MGKRAVPKRREGLACMPAKPEWGWTRDDREVAEAEGWGIFWNTKYGTEIERCDTPMVFVSDELAWAWVHQHAEAGSPLHEKAWRIHCAAKLIGV